jgi:hypothetical protein
MHSQTLHKRPSDVYLVCECIGTVYTCMNSCKETFNTIITTTKRSQCYFCLYKKRDNLIKKIGVLEVQKCIYFMKNFTNLDRSGNFGY